MDNNDIPDSPLEGGGYKKDGSKTNRKGISLGIDTKNIIGKQRSSKAPTVGYKPQVTASKKIDHNKEKRASLMPVFVSIMREAPGVKISSPERRRILNNVIDSNVLAPIPEEEGMMMMESPTDRIRDAIRANIKSIIDAREQKTRKAYDEMDLDDLLAGLSMNASKPVAVATKPKASKSSLALALAKEAALRKEKTVKQALERTMRYQRREDVREKLQQLKEEHGLDMDVDVLVDGMSNDEVNAVLTSTSENDLLAALMNLKFGGAKKQKSTKKAKKNASGARK